VSEDLFTELVNILGQSAEKSARDAEIDYQKYREKIGMGEKNTVCDIDTLGFDYLVIDEAHRCKNVFEQVKSDDEGNKRYNITSAVSETGIKAFFHANYIQRTYGNNVMLLTATPFTNSPLEIYSMLSLVAYDSMRRNGIYHINAFFDTFVLPTVEWTTNIFCSVLVYFVYILKYNHLTTYFNDILSNKFDKLSSILLLCVTRL
jgi:N12 class adenine-specific DNA methylase